MAAVQWYDFNVQHPPFRSAKVRRAFSYALDRPAIIKKFLYGDEKPSHSILPPSLSLLDSQNPLDFNLEIAQKLFQEGLEEQGLEEAILKPLKMVVYDREPHKTIARAVIHAWEEAFGLSFVLEVVSWHDFFERIRGSTHDILGHVWYSWYKDPLYSLSLFKSKTNSMNSSRWSNEKYTKLIDTAEVEIDNNQRKSLLKDAEEMILHEMPIVPVFDYNSRYLKNEHVDNIYVSHLGNVDFKWTTFS
jgi:oligopeptide transport system substrate-binding protein